MANKSQIHLVINRKRAFRETWCKNRVTKKSKICLIHCSRMRQTQVIEQIAKEKLHIDQIFGVH